MELYLRVIEGNPADAVFRLSDGEIILGRSKQCSIRLDAPDISRQHARLLVMPDRVVVDNLSQHGTSVDDAAVVEEMRLRVDQTLRLGKKTALLLSETPGDGEIIEIEVAPLPDALPGSITLAGTAEVTAGAGATDESAWVDRLDIADGATGVLGGEDASGTGSASENELATGWAEMTGAGDEAEDEEGKTRELHTRQGSLEEIEMMKAALRRRTRARIFGVLGAVVLLIILAAALWPRPPEPEVIIEWPADAAGTYLEKIVATPIEGLSIVCPGDDVQTQEDASGGMVIHTRIGRDRDVDLVLFLDTLEDRRLAAESRADALKRWKARMEEGSDKWGFGAPLTIPIFIGPESGIPIIFLDYTRIGGGREWAGRARLLRLGSQLVVLRTEVDQRERSRADDMLSYTYLEANLDLVRGYWEGNGEESSKPLAALVAQARRELKRDVPVLWVQNRRLLAQVLRESVAQGDTAAHDWAMTELRRLSQRQSEWYNAKFLALIRAENVADEAEIERIVNACQKVFSDPDDQRFNTIRNW